MYLRRKLLIFGMIVPVIIARCTQVDAGNTKLTITTTTAPSTATATKPPTETPPPTKSPDLKTSSLKPILTSEDCLSAGYPESACSGVFENGQWEAVIGEFNGVKMVLVPAGCFLMGNDEGFPEEQPAHEVCLRQPFWIDLTEVTVSQFAEFLNGQPEPVDDYDRWLNVWGTTTDLIHIQLTNEDQTWRPLKKEAQRPSEHVTWIGANEYCTWRDARLPSEAEWEYAARGPDNFLYPWGNEMVRGNIVIYKGKNPEVGSKPTGASWVGALDMSGSVFEWTSTIYQPYPYDPFDGREQSLEKDSQSPRVFRGSAWYHHWNQMWDNVSATARFESPPDFANWYFGFRCARSFE